MNKTILAGLLGLAACRLSAQEAAPSTEPAAEPKRTEITASRLVFDHEKMHAVFEGQVVVQDPSMRMEADTLTVQMDKASQQITSARAVGRVKITEKDRVATGDQAEYNAREGKLVLVGKPARVKRGKEDVSGDTITFYRNDNRIEVERVTMVLFPEKGQSLQGMIQ